METKLKFPKTAQLGVLSLPATMPVIFGSVHPVVVGLFTAFMLLFCGGWLLLNHSQISQQSNRWYLLFLFFIGWLVLTSIPLPLALLEILSPARAASLDAINRLTDATVTSATLSYNSGATLMTALFLFSLLLYARTLESLLDADNDLLVEMIYVCITVAVLETGYGLIQVVSPHLGVLWLADTQQFKGMARGTIIYKNQYASLLNMCWPLALGAALLRFKKARSTLVGQEWRKRRRSALLEKINSYSMQGVILLFTASFIMLGVIFSQSRGGIISMVMILIMLLIFIPLERKSKVWLAGCMTLIPLLYGSIVGFSAVIERFLVIGQGGQNRFEIYTSSLPMLYDHLLTGTGLESYRLLSSLYLKFFPEHLLYDRVHNEYLELTIELGLPLALLLFSTLFLAIFLQGKQLLLQRKKKLYRIRSPKIIAITGWCAIIGFLFHGIADFGWRLPVNLLYCVILAVLVRTAQAYSTLTTHK